MIRSNLKKVLWFTATAATVVAAVFLYPVADRPPKTALSAPEVPPHFVRERSGFQKLPTLAYAPTPTATPSQSVTSVTVVGAEPQFGPHSTARNLPEKPPYIPSAEELQRYGEVKAKAYTSGMNLRAFVMLKDYGTLPEPMRQQLFGEIVMMAMRGEMGTQFLSEPSNAVQ